MLSYCETLRYIEKHVLKYNKKQQIKLFSVISQLQTHYHFKLDFQKVDKNTGGKLLIHSTKHRKDNQLQTWDYPVKHPSWESRYDIMQPEGNWFNPLFK